MLKRKKGGLCKKEEDKLQENYIMNKFPQIYQECSNNYIFFGCFTRFNFFFA